MPSSVLRVICLTAAVSCLTACAPLLTMIGTGGSVVQIAAQLDRVKLIADGVSYVSSKKTLSERALSLAAGADCRIMNVVSDTPMCASQNRDASNSDPYSPQMSLTARTAKYKQFAAPVISKIDPAPAGSPTME